MSTILEGRCVGGPCDRPNCPVERAMEILPEEGVLDTAAKRFAQAGLGLIPRGVSMRHDAKGVYSLAFNCPQCDVGTLTVYQGPDEEAIHQARRAEYPDP